MTSLRFPARRVSCLLAATLCLAAPTHAGTIHVFLIGGQSNADGRANIRGSSQNLPPSLTAPQEDVPIYYATSAPSPRGGKYPLATKGALTTLRPGQTFFPDKLGPELSFGRSMADFYAKTGDPVALIKYAVGGSSLSVDWKADGRSTKAGDGGSYQNFQKVVKEGLIALQAAHPTDKLVISGMIWMQGETDADAARSPDYQENLTRFIADVRSTYGANLPFVIGQLSRAQTHIDATCLETVRQAQGAVTSAHPRNALVVTDTFGTNSDRLHFNRPAQVALGNAFAAEMQKLVARP